MTVSISISGSHIQCSVKRKISTDVFKLTIFKSNCGIFPDFPWILNWSVLCLENCFYWYWFVQRLWNFDEMCIVSLPHCLDRHCTLSSLYRSSLINYSAPIWKLLYLPFLSQSSVMKLWFCISFPNSCLFFLPLLCARTFQENPNFLLGTFEGFNFKSISSWGYIIFPLPICYCLEVLIIIWEAYILFIFVFIDDNVFMSIIYRCIFVSIFHL